MHTTRITFTVEMDSEDIIGLKEIVAACAERFGEMKFIRIEEDKPQQQGMDDWVDRAIREARQFRDSCRR